MRRARRGTVASAFGARAAGRAVVDGMVHGVPIAGPSGGRIVTLGGAERGG